MTGEGERQEMTVRHVLLGFPKISQTASRLGLRRRRQRQRAAAEGREGLFHEPRARGRKGSQLGRATRKRGLSEGGITMMGAAGIYIATKAAIKQEPLQP